jgi:hypothetical protein
MNEQKEYKPEGAKFFAGAVYVGVVLAATTLFISMVLSAFAADAYFSRAVMSVAGLMIGASMLAFPVALHAWAVEAKHHLVTTVLYYVEMLFIAVNTIVSFLVLLGSNTGYVVPEWAMMYEPFSVGAIVYTLAAWGTVFLLDPSHKRLQKSREAHERFQDKVSAKEMEFLDSVEGEEAVMTAAMAKIAERYDASKFSSDKKHFGKASEPALADQLFTKKEAEAKATPFRSGDSHES